MIGVSLIPYSVVCCWESSNINGRTVGYHMGSIYPHFEGTRWDRLSYDSYDLDKHITPVFMNIYKWRVRKGRERITVYAATIDDAKLLACKRRGWRMEDITEVRALIAQNASNSDAYKVMEYNAMRHILRKGE